MLVWSCYTHTHTHTTLSLSLTITASQATMLAHFFLLYLILFLLFFSGQKDISFFFITLSIIIITKQKVETKRFLLSPIPKLPLQALKKAQIIKPQIKKIMTHFQKEPLPLPQIKTTKKKNRAGKKKEEIFGCLFTHCLSPSLPPRSLERRKNKNPKIK